MIGIAITTFNRAHLFQDTLHRVLALAPEGCPVVVVDDGSAQPVAVPDGVTLYRFDRNQGIAIAKNKCLELLCHTRAEHFFLFDDDTYPTAPGWWQPYVQSCQPHLMYEFASGPAHWHSHVIGGDDGHRAFDKPRGCMLYVERRVVAQAGGMHPAFGKHGGEHGNWSDRIHALGLTRYAYADVRAPAIHCRDQDEAGISSVDWRQHQQWRTVDAGSLPIFASFLGPVPVLVPRRADGGHRDALWDLVKRKYWDGFDSFVVVEGEHTSGPFNRSRALNRASAAAGAWSVAVIADSDSFVPPPRLRFAVLEALRTGRLVAAFDEVHELSAAQTETLLRAASPVIQDWGWPPERIRTERGDPTTVQSTMLAVPRCAWEAAGGFDEGFVGWGGEDNAFWRACELFTGPPERIPGAAYHLWHPPGRPARATDPYYLANLARARRYAQALCADDIRRLRA